MRKAVHLVVVENVDMVMTTVFKTDMAAAGTVGTPPLMVGTCTRFGCCTVAATLPRNSNLKYRRNTQL